MLEKLKEKTRRERQGDVFSTLVFTNSTLKLEEKEFKSIIHILGRGC